MAGSKLNNYSSTDNNITQMQLTMDASYIGKLDASLTESTTTTVPAMSGGSVIECSGALYKFSTEEAISTAGLTATSGQLYIKITPTSSQVTADFSTVTPVWRDTLQGWYESTSSNNRMIGGVYLSTSGEWTEKYLQYSRYEGERKWGPQPEYLNVQYQYTGGAASSIAEYTWQSRTINTEVHNSISGASLSSNAIILPAGSYYIDAYGEAYYSYLHKVSTGVMFAVYQKLRVFNSSASSETVTGRHIHKSRLAYQAGSTAQIEEKETLGTELSGYFSITSSAAFYLQQYSYIYETISSTVSNVIYEGSTFGTVALGGMSSGVLSTGGPVAIGEKNYFIPVDVKIWKVL
jgi:hypothetical protein